MGEWIEQNLKEGTNVGVDPFLFSKEEFEKLNNQLSSHEINLTPLKCNLVDTIWKDRTARPNGKLTFLPIEFSGKRTSEKLVDIRNEIKKVGASYLVVTALDEIACMSIVFDIFYLSS